MTWVLDAPVHVGPVAIAAIIEKEIKAHSTQNSIRAMSRKHPLVVLIARSDDVEIFDLKGRKLDVDEVETRYPGAITQLIEHSRSAE